MHRWCHRKPMFSKRAGVPTLATMGSPRQPSQMDVVKTSDLQGLLEFCTKTVFSSTTSNSEQARRNADIQQKCEDLFAKDYVLKVIENEQGSMSSTYPNRIILLEHPIGSQNTDTSPRPASGPGSLPDVQDLREQIQKARIARCRTRFPVPVILYEGKHICRSATLAGGAEIYSRSGFDFLFSDKRSTENRRNVDNGNTRASNNTEPLQPHSLGLPSDYTDTESNASVAAAESLGEDENFIDLAKDNAPPATAGNWPLFSTLRMEDIRLLRLLSVDHICDFMVENKKVKFFLKVTSSEKVDKENRYNGFTIYNLPYPGCEFFKHYRDNDYSGEGLIYDWDQHFVNAPLNIPDDAITSQLNIDWTMYKTWDVVVLTRNYLKLLLKYTFDGTSGLLVHCISGWDRTPLFISLLRLSLWADNKIHPNLSPLEMAYLTVAYDWFLFCHDLRDRLSKGEEIFYFCFNMLKHLDTEEFSVISLKVPRERRNTSESNLESIFLEEEMRGSNTSLNSSCSSSTSGWSQDVPPMYFPVPVDSGDEYPLSNGNYVCPGTNGAATPPTMTNSSESAASTVTNGRGSVPPSSPMAVPTSLRHRSESSSSVSAGSWQIINGTGSVRSSTSARDSPTAWELNRNSSSSRSSLSSRHQDAPTDLPDRTLPRSKFLQRRRDRLTEVRRIVSNIYLSIVADRLATPRTDGISRVLQSFYS
ncbi:phosphatidylinositol-3,5-bisphosphate 3-phosphatase MTMR14-like isoform X1 [Dermacentor andersoni]|uniref:phosphatidylinositol-3,5-bisphosphate 3-phosphatase MTMR14-like isoform X1 n=1 Tax=Dermacentor andersoni TaxID=34620 RepID=UPI002155E896|nr:myotubularin-related protein 14-like isoform X1 [Dermacentor andersoni]